MKRKWVLWVVVGSVAVLSCTIVVGLLAGDTTSRTTSAPSKPRPTPTPQAKLFADASNGIEQFVGADNMPAGTYDFRCSSLGNVSIQLGRAPYTVSLKQGDQTRTVRQGDLLTVGYCKVYGPK